MATCARTQFDIDDIIYWFSIMCQIKVPSLCLCCIALHFFVSIFIPPGHWCTVVVRSMNYFLFFYFSFSCLVACFYSRLSTNITCSVIVFNLTPRLEQNVTIIPTAYFVNCTYVCILIFPVFIYFNPLCTVQWKIYSESIFAIRQDFYDPGKTLNKLCFKIYRQIWKWFDDFYGTKIKYFMVLARCKKKRCEKSRE